MENCERRPSHCLNAGIMRPRITAVKPRPVAPKGNTSTLRGRQWGERALSRSPEPGRFRSGLHFRSVPGPWPFGERLRPKSAGHTTDSRRTIASPPRQAHLRPDPNKLSDQDFSPFLNNRCTSANHYRLRPPSVAGLLEVNTDKANRGFNHWRHNCAASPFIQSSARLTTMGRLVLV